jgi:RNA polymerase sigma-70 factor (ECF subfamily)
MTTTRQTEAQNDFGLLVDTYQTEILRYLRRLTGDGATADDLFQDTFLRAFKAFSRLRSNPNHRAWLYRIATNRFLNHRRRGWYRVEVPLAAEIRSRTPSPAAIHERATVADTLRQAIAHLPKRQSAAFIQRQLHGFNYKEVSAVLGCTETAARANVYQAVRRLRRELVALRRTT